MTSPMYKHLHNTGSRKRKGPPLEVFSSQKKELLYLPYKCSTYTHWTLCYGLPRTVFVYFVKLTDY